MARSPFGRGRSGEVDPELDQGISGDLTAFIDQGSEFEGKVSFKDTVRIDGRFRGEITSENTLVVGETGEIHANIQSRIVMVSGTVIGDISARERLVLFKTARIEGNVRSKLISVEEGAQINGRFQTRAGKGANEKTGSEGPRALQSPQRGKAQAAQPLAAGPAPRN